MANDLHPLTEEIAQRLAETDPGPKAQISQALQVLGVDRVEAAVVEAQAIEAQGGLLNAAGDGLHTLGGLFFKGLRREATREEWRQIHSPRFAANGELQPPLNWADRVEAVQAARARSGVVTNCSVSVAGRPAGVNRQGEDYLVMAVESNHTLPSLPGYLPLPSAIATSFKIVVSQTQWRKLQSPMRNPQSQLVAYGYPIPNVRQKAVVLFALTAGVQAQSEADEPMAVARAKITATPGEVVRRGATVVLALEGSQAPPAVLAEYPDLPQRVVSYVAYIAEKQWRKITESSEAAGFSVAINGLCFYDSETESLSILAQNLHLV